MPHSIIEVVPQADDLIPPEHADIHARLVNWGRWCRSRKHVGKVDSLEGRYRAPRGAEFEWETATPPPTPLASPDDLDGLAIELVWRMIPEKHRKALRLFYVFRADAKFCCQRLHIKRVAWGHFIGHARQMTANLLLTTRKRQSIIPAQFVNSA